MTDLSNLVPKHNTIEITLKNPDTKSGDFKSVLLNEDKTPMTITVLAPHSREYKAAVHNQTQLRLKKAEEKNTRDFTFEDYEEVTIGLFVDTTTDWNITWGGKQPKYSKKLAAEIYDKAFWIRNQVDEGVQEAALFT